MPTPDKQTQTKRIKQGSPTLAYLIPINTQFPNVYWVRGSLVQNVNY